jgi:hypothetical protein
VSLHSQEQGINWILTEFVVVSLTWIRCFLIELESRLHFKHSLSWCPRPPRDLLLSVALENFSPLKLPNEALPQLTPQVVQLALLEFSFVLCIIDDITYPWHLLHVVSLLKSKFEY